MAGPSFLIGGENNVRQQRIVEAARRQGLHVGRRLGQVLLQEVGAAAKSAVYRGKQEQNLRGNVVIGLDQLVVAVV